MNDATDDQVTSDEDRRARVVHRVRVREVNAEQIAARYALDAVLAVGERRLQSGEVDQLGERQGDHGEIDAMAADRYDAEGKTEDACADCSGQDRKLERKAPHLRRMSRDVSRTAKKSGVTERQQPGRSHRKLVGAGEQAKTDHLDEERRVEQIRRNEQSDEARQGVLDAEYAFA